jgi:hypothetical protein
LKAEFMGGDAIGGSALGAGAGAEGMDRSRRSPRPDEDAAGWDGAGDENEEKSERPLEGLVVRFCCAYEGALGLESKKLPPPPNMFDEDVVGGDFVLEKLSSPENGEGFAAGCEAWLNDKLLKASFIPPKDDCCGDICP